MKNYFEKFQDKKIDRVQATSVIGGDCVSGCSIQASLECDEGAWQAYGFSSFGGCVAEFTWACTLACQASN